MTQFLIKPAVLPAPPVHLSIVQEGDCVSVLAECGDEMQILMSIGSWGAKTHHLNPDIAKMMGFATEDGHIQVTQA